MDLSLFCDTYIIAEYSRLDGIICNMPRYKAGMHEGKQVIREYFVNDDKVSRRVVNENSRFYAEKQKQFEFYNTLQQNLAQYKQELIRRRLTVPGNFRFIKDSSPYNIDVWNQLIPCSNNREINNEYYDDYGFHVRTRGEMMVGNVLKDLGLEAKYEPALILKGGRKKNPDYSFPISVIDRCFFIEFMGMADDEGYIESNYGKIDEYMRNGILLNRDLIVIAGTGNWLPEQESIKRIIAAFINNAVLSTYNRK